MTSRLEFGTTSQRAPRRLYALGGMVAGILLAGIAPAFSDTTYVPTSPNGQKVYLSRSCHGSGGSSNCVTNTGCDGFSENNRSRLLATAVKNDLLTRGYRVRIGDQGVSGNIASSNSWNATMHIPLHSNAAGSAACAAPVDKSTRGSHALWAGNPGKKLGEAILYFLDTGSPGTDDRTVGRTDLGELNSTDAVASYLESEFHDWNRGMNWLRESNDWAWRIATGVDRCRGYPRDNSGPTTTKSCGW